MSEDTASSADERYRESAIDATRLLESGAEEVLDRITRIAARALKMPIAAVSVLHEHTQTFKASVGLDIQSTPRHIAFCQRALDLDRLLVVRDASAHPDFTANPLVTGAPQVPLLRGHSVTDAIWHRNWYAVRDGTGCRAASLSNSVRY